MTAQWSRDYTNSYEALTWCYPDAEHTGPCYQSSPWTYGIRHYAIELQYNQTTQLWDTCTADVEMFWRYCQGIFQLEISDVLYSANCFSW